MGERYHVVDGQRVTTRFDNCPLTDRQLEIVQGLAEGMYLFEVAKELWISTSTVKTHINNVRKRLGLSGVRMTHAQAVAICMREGWIK
jgi:DNA-binding NarL/FixJ family response regulator